MIEKRLCVVRES